MGGLTGLAHLADLGRMTPTVHILILAAGASTRMRGADKLMEPVGDRPMLRHIAEQALATGSPVIVTVPPDAPARTEALVGLDLRIITVPDAALGMSRSLVRGIAALLAVAGPMDGVMVLPADMPELGTPALSDMIAHFRAKPQMILRGSSEESGAGHPAVFPRDLWSELLKVTGDTGGRAVLQANADRVRVIPLPGTMATLDLDTPEDWAAWRAAHP